MNTRPSAPSKGHKLGILIYTNTNPAVNLTKFARKRRRVYYPQHQQLNITNVNPNNIILSDAGDEQPGTSITTNQYNKQ